MGFILLGITVWNHWQIADRCVQSIRANTDMTNVELILFDNGSDDESTKQWLAECGEKVYHIGENKGCCGGIRTMFEYSFTRDDIEFVAPMCPDILFTKDCFTRLLDVMQTDERIISVSPKDNNGYHIYEYFEVPKEVDPESIPIGDIDYSIRMLGDDTKLQEYINQEFYARRKHPAFLDVRSTEWSVILWRKSLLRQIGNLREDFSYALGDIELFIRIANHNEQHSKEEQLRVIYCLSSFVYHQSHGSAGLYEGYQKKFNRTLNLYAEERMNRIKELHAVDCADYGLSKHGLSAEVVHTERALVKLGEVPK